MKRSTAIALASSLPFLGACIFHKASWRAQRDDTTQVVVVADTQPVVRQEGAPRRHISDKPTTSPTSPKPMTQVSISASDGRTIGMYLMSNDVDISFSSIAYASAGSDDVKAFARRMLTDHSQLVAQMRSLVDEHGMSPSDDDAARDLRDLATLQRDSLRALSGRAFDSTYVAMELDRHREILSMIDDVLLPRARSSELRELLASTRPIIAAHVAHAEQLQETLRKR